MANLSPVLRQRFFDANGAPLAGGKLYSYIAGTSTPLATFVDSTEVTPNANPIVLDANGEANVWMSDSLYKFILTNSLDVTQWSVDQVSTTGSAAPVSAWTTHAITDGQAATSLVGQTADGASYSSVVYEYEIIRGTTVLANGRLTLQYRNATWIVQTGNYDGDLHGVTFTVAQTTTVAQLKAALDIGAGNGTIKLSRRLVAA